MQLSDSDATQRIECFCARRPLLARAGRDTRTGLAFVWIKTIKGKQVMAEVIATSGTIRIRCRHCLRFHAVTIHQQVGKIYDIKAVDEKDFVADLK